MLKPENYFDQFVLCWLATVSEKGVPNVSPKELFIFEQEKQLLIANIASPQSVKNIRANPQVYVSGGKYLDTKRAAMQRQSRGN